MRNLTTLALSTVVGLSTFGTVLCAQTAPAPAGPTVKFRGSIWASGVISDKELPDGSVPFRSFLDQGNGELALDGATIGADVTLNSNWSLKFTALGGQFAKVLNATDSPNAEDKSSLALAEAQLIYTAGDDTFKIGRMWTPLGMEVADQSANITASRGILFCNVLPLSQVGVNWHHAFAPSFSTDVYVINGEDKIKDNNQGKTYGLQATYNHGGASDKFATLILFRGAEQNGLGANINSGAEGRIQERASFSGQWVWGPSTLQWEADYKSTPDATDEKAKTTGFGAIYKYQFNEAYAGFLRAETMKTTYKTDDDKLTSYCVGLERKWGAVFSRFELRHDSASNYYRDTDHQLILATDGKAIKDANSATISFGASF